MDETDSRQRIMALGSEEETALGRQEDTSDPEENGDLKANKLYPIDPCLMLLVCFTDDYV